MDNVQETAMNNLLYGLTNEGDKLLESFKALQDALQFPSSEVGVLLENAENLDLTDEELEAKMNEYTEEAADRDYQAAETNEERDQAKFKHMDDSVMYERYKQALDYRKNVAKVLNDFDNQLRKTTDVIEKFNKTDVMKDIQAALKPARNKKTDLSDADKAYIDSLNDFVDFYNYYVNMVDGMRMMVSDRKAQFDDEFNKKREAVQENNNALNVEISKLETESKSLDEEFSKLEDEEEFYLRTNDFQNPKYLEIVNRKKEISSRRFDINEELSQKKALLQTVAYDYDFGSYKVGQRDIINLDLGIKKYLKENSDLEAEMKSHAMNAKKRAPRFEYYFDEEGKLIASIVVNGTTKTKTVGDYKNVSVEEIQKAVKDLIFTMAASSKGLDLNTVARFDFQLAEYTPVELDFKKSNENDTFRMTDVSKFLYEQVKNRKLEDEKLDDLRKDVEAEVTKGADEKEETKEAPAEEAPAEEAPVVETPAEETPAVDATEEEVKAEEAPAQETPSEETPSEETPSEEKEEDKEKSEENKEKYGLRVVSARPYTFSPKLKAGNSNDYTRNQNSEQARTYDNLVEKNTVKKIIIPLMVGCSALGVIGAPALATALVFGGSVGAATLLGKAPNLVVAARRHKLDRLAEKIGLKIGYNIDALNYDMGFVDPKNPNMKLSEEEVLQLGKEVGVDVQAELDKIAGNKYRGIGDVEIPYKERDINKASERLHKKYAKLANEFGLKVDEYYYSKTKELHLIPIDQEVISEKNGEVEFTDEIKAECEKYHLDDSLSEELDKEEYESFKEASDKLLGQYEAKKDAINKKDYDEILLWSRKARKLNAQKDLEKVKPNNLAALFDDIGGISIPKKSRIGNWIKKHFVDNAPVIIDEQEQKIESQKEIEGEVIDEEVVDTVEQQQEVEAPVDEVVQAEEAPAQAAPAPETSTQTEVAPSDVNSDDLNIEEAILNATTVGRDEFVDETEVPRAEVVQEAMAEEKVAQANSNDIQAYMEATIDAIEDTLPDLVRANPAEAEKFVVNHPEYQEYYNKILAELNPEPQSLGV